MTIKLTTPLSEKKIMSLKIGDIVELSGTIFTARDKAHKYIFNKGKLPFDLKNQILYHCGPIIIKQNNQWIVKAAGPTTSMRQEPYEWELIQDFNLKAIIGKGGMGEKTLKAMKKHKCCYLHTIGGAAAFLGKKITKVKNVYLLDKLGPVEAIWELEVRNLPAIVTMDAMGNSMHN